MCPNMCSEKDVYKGTPKGNKYEMGGKQYISKLSLTIIPLGIYTEGLYKVGMREPLLIYKVLKNAFESTLAF